MILVIDDDVDSREIVVTVLEGKYPVQQASNGEQALALLRGGLRPRIIFCDLHMPVLDGEGFCKAWCADHELHRIPLVIVSGSSYSDLVALKRRLGVSLCLQKPVNPFEFERVIRRLAA